MDQAAILRHFSISSDDILGGGGEADVYALDRRRVLRLMHEDACAKSEARRRDMLALLAKRDHMVDFAIPRVLDHGTRSGRIFTIEERIAGISMDNALMGQPTARADLITNYMQAARDVADLYHPPQFGELCADEPQQAATQTQALEAIARRSLRLAGLSGDVTAIPTGELPDAGSPALVQLDYYPANVMCDGSQITGVIDFGYATIAADARLTPIVAGACLHSRITARATDADREVADAWLAQRDLMRFVAPVNRWLACYWAFAFADDPALEIWGRAQLGL